MSKKQSSVLSTLSLLFVLHWRGRNVREAGISFVFPWLVVHWHSDLKVRKIKSNSNILWVSILLKMFVLSVWSEAFTAAHINKIILGYQLCQLVKNQRFRDQQRLHHQDLILQFNQPTKKLRAEFCASARHRPLLGLTIPAYETRFWKW
jgi:hypothetical protein